MQRYALIGHPIAQSPSPAMHNAAFKHLGIDAIYERFEADEHALSKVQTSLENPIWSGFNVTTPMKEHVATLVTLEGHATRAKATNTLFRRDNRWFGYLTDVEGIVEPLRARPVQSSGTMLIIGSGGATRAAALAGEMLGLSVIIAARRPEAAHAIIHTLKLNDDCHAVALDDTTAMHSALQTASVLVQATPVGRNNERHDIPWHALPPHAIAFEMLYAAKPTAFLEDAQHHGLACVEGWEMLLAQGARAFEIWTQRKAPIEIMRKAMFENMHNKIL